jgi:CubicO group peptidase (beta-lactamase class C family)
MLPVYRTATLRDLFSHQAGLQANIDTAALTAFRADPRSLHEQRLAYARLALSQPPAYTPRAGNLYSNSGPVIAAVIAERVTGLSYEQLMQQELFTPLAMRTAAFGPTHRGQPLGHDHGKPQTGPDADNAPVIAPAGEIHLSMDDWAKFAIDQVEGEHGRGKLLKAATYRILHSPPRPGSPFALGWSVSDSLGGARGPFLTHAGSNTYWYAVIVLNTRTESGILVAANAGIDAGADVVEGRIVKALLPSLEAGRR